MEPGDATRFIINMAAKAGLDDCGIAPAIPVPTDRSTYESYLKAGMNSDMDYLSDTIEQRFNPDALLPGVKNVVVCLSAYKSSMPGYSARPANRAFISRYAWGRDYHVVVLQHLLALIDMVKPVIGGNYLPFVDIGPIFEKAYAEKAGLGFIGKNTLLIHPVYGSFVFLGVLLTDLDLESTPQKSKHACNLCTKCIDACPVGALQPFSLNANKCIGHLNNMYRGSLKGFNPQANIFGCDICQDACPYNKFAAKKDESPFLPEHDYNRFPDPDFLQGLSNRGVRKAFYETPVAIQRPKKLKEIARIIAEESNQ